MNLIDRCIWWQSSPRTPYKQWSRRSQWSKHLTDYILKAHMKVWAQRSLASRKWCSEPSCAPATHKYIPQPSDKTPYSTSGCICEALWSNGPVWADRSSLWNHTSHSHLWEGRTWGRIWECWFPDLHAANWCSLVCLVSFVKLNPTMWTVHPSGLTSDLPSDLVRLFSGTQARWCR